MVKVANKKTNADKKKETNDKKQDEAKEQYALEQQMDAESVVEQAPGVEQELQVEDDQGTEVSMATTASSATKADKPTKKKKKLTKRTPSCYILYSMEMRKTIVKNDNTHKLSDISKACSASWKALPEEEKRVWMDKAAELRKKRLEEIEAASLNPIVENEEVYAGCKAVREPKKKRGLTSYMLFCREQRNIIKAEHPEFSLVEVSKECGRAWQTLNEDTKAEWKQKAVDLACQAA